MRVLAPFTALILLSGCATHPPRGNLSDAMEASASGSGSVRNDHRYPQTTSRATSQSNATAGRGGGGGGGGGDLFADIREDDIWRVPMDFSQLTPLNGNIQAINRITLTPLGLEDGRNFVGFYLGAGWVDLKNGSLPDRAVRRAHITEFGVSYRRYLNDPHVFLSPYFATHLAWQPLHWTYRNPIAVGDDVITTDTLSGINVYTGFGVAIWRAKHLSLFTEAGLGGTVYWRNTREGFRNDVFDDFGYITVKAGLTVRF